MAHLWFENGVNECLKSLEAPITNGPKVRWQRKEEQRSGRQSDGPLSPLPNNFSRTTTPSVKNRRKTPLKPQKTPKKTPKKPAENSAPVGDRFIPNRSATDCEWGHYQMVHGGQDQDDSSDNADEMIDIPQTSKDKQNDSKAEGSRILHFKTGAPANKEGYQNNLRVLYCQSKPSGPKAKSVRHIPQAPDRILDAPDIVDDYYLNILDWGSNNLVGLALGGAVYVWHADSGETHHLLQMEGEEYVSSVSWIKECSILAVGNSNGQVQVRHTNNPLPQWIRCLNYSPVHESESSRTRLLFTSRRFRTRMTMKNSVLDLSSNTTYGNVFCAACSGKKNVPCLAVPFINILTGLNNFSSNQTVETRHGTDLFTVIRNLVYGNCKRHGKLWDAEVSKCVRIMGGHASRISALSWNTYILSSGSRSGAIHNHDVRVATHHVGTLLNHTQEVCGLEWSLDGKFLASGGNDNIINIWPMVAGESTNETPLFSLNRHQAAIKALAWCPFQANVLASGGGTADRHIRFWNASTGVCLNSFDTKSQVSSLLWSSEYKEIISGHGFSQNQLTIWKYPAMSRVADLTGHTSRILQMSMSPDGQFVASVAADETLRIWKCFARSQKQKKVHKAEEASNLMSSMKLR